LDPPNVGKKPKTFSYRLFSVPPSLFRPLGQASSTRDTWRRKCSLDVL
jgi:hypothetical protein